jgi:hypothetical protein
MRKFVELVDDPLRFDAPEEPFTASEVDGVFHHPECELAAGAERHFSRPLAWFMARACDVCQRCARLMTFGWQGLTLQAWYARGLEARGALEDELIRLGLVRTSVAEILDADRPSPRRPHELMKDAEGFWGWFTPASALDDELRAQERTLLRGELLADLVRHCARLALPFDPAPEVPEPVRTGLGAATEAARTELASWETTSVVLLKAHRLRGSLLEPFVTLTRPETSDDPDYWGPTLEDHVLVQCPRAVLAAHARTAKPGTYEFVEVSEPLAPHVLETLEVLGFAGGLEQALAVAQAL